MKISVILPCFNGAKTIAIQLEALTKQQWSEYWEVVVVNNGSTDKSMAIVEQYRERLPNLRIVEAHEPSQPRRGVAHSYNTGVKAATGDAVVFCESDDEVAPGWLTAMGEALQQYDFVAGALEYRKFNEAWQLGTGEHNQEKKLIQCTLPPYLPYASGCNLGMKRSVYKAVGEFDVSVLGSWDTDFCWRAQYIGIELHYVPNAIIHYRYRRQYRAMYRQGKSWGEAHILLRKKHEPDINWGKIPVLRYLLGICSYLPKGFVRIHNRTAFTEWLWGLGWEVGLFKGLVKHVVFPSRQISKQLVTEAVRAITTLSSD